MSKTRVDRIRREEFGLRLKLAVLLKEADMFQSEMDKRLDRHAQSFNFCILLLAGVITGIATFADKDIAADFLFVMLVFLPFLTTPLAAMFFDDELLRGVSDFRFHQEVVPEIRSVVASAGFTSDDLFRCTLTSRFGYMRRDLNIQRSRLAATARRFIFLVPFVLAFLSLIGALSGFNGYFSYHPIRAVTKYICIIVALTDCLLLWLTMNMWSSAQSIWQRVTQAPSVWREFVSGSSKIGRSFQSKLPRRKPPSF